ncbi:beta-1,3-galactosyl-O-glycosyl-glycoprotein beta-1,6-N-acetylglucosaminyltransferase 4-like isoform X1 [Betta splendens]|uniref:Beta-1,3-galactosyl-O-glycosyl-glycoprotein beta-1,6-N-acetylglucosaminyltransferase 4-like isoform X1 n=1 Tax=Betta splendens TaxID=158456 RepID=A0A6P7NYZ2_BETSP|nr:beta-1,3-galactosyl-O-glycosyl-glycoprotein beta-1,6-N-acetylglucosaminyltransferase 4-like isoform X1 [Betta splendens]XP_029025218.1 beta-1,3-galactosyl-O-glycosyl-glycoprotein beta-1,6-N-acetylglucosaminyltransferase 4-like isoform X1 [Betta splendens]
MNRRLRRLRKKLFLTLSLSVLTFCVLLLIVDKYKFIIEPFTSLEEYLMVQRYNIDCSAIYDRDPVEVGKSLLLRQNETIKDKEINLLNLVSNCSLFLRFRGYDQVCVSDKEKNFPIAYSLVVHKHAWMVERLIRATYSPSNIYCIHYDRKSLTRFIAAMEGLAHCLPNVFIASKLEDVKYAGFSRLKADLNCLSDLLQSEVKWKYVINLCGQDFPLKPNIELVSELKKLNGANMLETRRPTMFKRSRFSRTPPPHDIQLFIGSAYFVLSREFVVFMNSSAVVKDFLAWTKGTYSPDEHFWATIVRLPGVPGEVPRSHPDIPELMSKTRLVKWSLLEGSLYPPCTGVYVRGVCIYGAAEINWLLNYGHWFANKFDTNVDPIAVQCLEETLEKRKNVFQPVAPQECFNYHSPL